MQDGRHTLVLSQLYRVGETIRIAYRGPGGYLDGVSIWKVDVEPAAQRSAAFVSGEEEGTVELTAPRPGRYEARYQPQVSSGQGTLATARFVVEAASIPEPASATGAMATGTYETYFWGNDSALNKWLAGEIVIAPGNRYTFQRESGRYGLDSFLFPTPPSP